MNKIISALASVALCAVFASCSLLNGNGLVIRKDKTPEKPAVEASASDSQKADRPGQTQTQTEPERPSKPASVSKLAGKLEGEWYILKAGSYEITAEESPYVYFEEDKGRFYANDGCNIINGDYTLSGDNVTFGNTLSTRKSCPGVLFAPAITKALSGSVKIDLQDKGQETMMTMKNAAGSTLMTLTRHNLSALNGQWYVMQIGEQKIDDENVNVFLDMGEMTTHGNTGCNFFNGTIVVNPHLTNSISFAQMGTTMRLCPDSDVEMAMMVALEQATVYHLDGHKLRLLDPSGTTLMVLERK
ncbi:MAG: META domain-containing protein [Muribaculaceae bacterium]|nr:META domain-containing protein [Muribaculaceae bacterium]